MGTSPDSQFYHAQTREEWGGGRGIKNGVGWEGKNGVGLVG